MGDKLFNLLRTLVVGPFIQAGRAHLPVLNVNPAAVQRPKLVMNANALARHSIRNASAKEAGTAMVAFKP